MTSVKNPGGTYTLTPAAGETAILNRAESAFGGDVLARRVEEIITELRKHFREKRQQDLRVAYENAASTSQEQVRNILGLLDV